MIRFHILCVCVFMAHLSLKVAASMCLLFFHLVVLGEEPFYVCVSITLLPHFLSTVSQSVRKESAFEAMFVPVLRVSKCLWCCMQLASMGTRRR